MNQLDKIVRKLLNKKNEQSLFVTLGIINMPVGETWYMFYACLKSLSTYGMDETW